MTRQQALHALSLRGTQAAQQELRQVASSLRAAALQQSTWRTHDSSFKWWKEFCKVMHYDEREALRDPLVLQEFAAFLYSVNHRPFAVLAGVSAIATNLWSDWRQKFYHRDSPLMREALAAENLIKRSARDAGVGSLEAAPIKLWWARVLPRPYWTPALTTEFQDLVIIAVGVLGLLRPGTIKNILVGQISASGVLLGRTKSNKEAREHRLDWPLPGRCPISVAPLVASWACLAHGKCFPSIRHAHAQTPLSGSYAGDGDHFFFNLAQPLARTELAQGKVGEAVSRYLAAVRRSGRAELIKDFVQDGQAVRAHGIRHGGATTLLEAGVSESIILARGLWQGVQSLRPYVHARAHVWSPSEMDFDAILLRLGDPMADEAGPLPTFDDLQVALQQTRTVSLLQPRHLRAQEVASVSTQSSQGEEASFINNNNNNSNNTVRSTDTIDRLSGLVVSVVGPQFQHQHQHIHETQRNNNNTYSNNMRE